MPEQRSEHNGCEQREPRTERPRRTRKERPSAASDCWAVRPHAAVPTKMCGYLHTVITPWPALPAEMALTVDANQ
jgi:hypothetical protein